MPSRKHIWRAVAGRALAAVALGLPIAGISLAPVAAQAAPPIVIGGTISETGPLATDGAYQIKGIELAIADANKAGGWLGRKLELKIYDDKSSAGTAVRLYERLITDDRVNLLIGPYSSLVTVGIAPLINKYKMATIEPGASDPSIYVAGNEWNFQGTASSIRYLDELLPAAKAQGATTVALLGLEIRLHARLLPRARGPGERARHEDRLSDDLFAAAAELRLDRARDQECAPGRGRGLHLLS